MKGCPRCGTELKVAQIGEILLDGCHCCGGVWFECQELNAVARSKADLLEDLEDRFLPGEPTPESLSETKCPNCQVALYGFEFPHAPGIRLDACPQCRGIWFDDGELHALHQRITGASCTTGSLSATDARRRGRQANGLLVKVECPKCHTPNPSIGCSCWACGEKLNSGLHLLCPNCDLPLAEKAYFGIRADVCNACTGLWLDAGELSVLAKHKPEELERIEAEARPDHTAISVMWDAERDMLCPVCSVAMQEREYAYGAEVKVEACERCSGLWVGAGKLPLFSRFYSKTLGRGNVPL